MELIRKQLTHEGFLHSLASSSGMSSSRSSSSYGGTTSVSFEKKNSYIFMPFNDKFFNTGLVLFMFISFTHIFTYCLRQFNQTFQIPRVLHYLQSICSIVILFLYYYLILGSEDKFETSDSFIVRKNILLSIILPGIFQSIVLFATHQQHRADLKEFVDYFLIIQTKQWVTDTLAIQEERSKYYTSCWQILQYVGLNFYYLIIGPIINFIFVKSLAFLYVTGLNLSHSQLITFIDDPRLLQDEQENVQVLIDNSVDKEKQFNQNKIKSFQKSCYLSLCFSSLLRFYYLRLLFPFSPDYLINFASLVNAIQMISSLFKYIGVVLFD